MVSKKYSKFLTDNGHRSGLEDDTAKYLKSLSIPFEYETDKITYTVDRTYTPDFPIFKSDGTKMYIETKGRFTSSDRGKHLTIQKQHPDKDIRFVFQEPHRKISPKSKTTYASWCDRHGFKWFGVDKKNKIYIPKEWLEE